MYNSIYIRGDIVNHQGLIKKIEEYNIRPILDDKKKNIIEVYEENFNDYVLTSVLNEIKDGNYESFISISYDDRIIICLYNKLSTIDEGKDYFVVLKEIVKNNDLNLILEKSKNN